MRKDFFYATEVLKDGLQLLKSAHSAMTNSSHETIALLGGADGQGRRHRFALRYLMSPAARLVLGRPTAQLQEMIVAEGLDLEDLARHGLMESMESMESMKSESGANLLEEPEEPKEPSAQDKSDVRSIIIKLLEGLDGRPLCREELDDHMRSMGRKKIKRPGMVIQSFRMAARLAELGVHALTLQENTKEIFTDSEASEAFTKATAATRHLAPDTDSCAAAIEALFACGAADAAEMIYSKCRSAFLPNPALYSAVIFGRLSCGNGQGATDAMLDMHSAGFVPHQRFLSRCLRLMGPFCQQGLLLIDRLGLDTMQRKLLHVLMEACNASFDPASSILELYQFLKQKGWGADGDTCFAMLRALCGMPNVDSAIQELNGFFQKDMIPAHPGFEILLRECFGLANSRHRALLVMEARRTWVEAVSEATCDGRRLIQTALELRREVEEELPVEAEEPDARARERIFSEEPWETEVHEDQDGDGQDAKTVVKSDSGNDVALDDSCFGPKCRFRWILKAYCVALPLHLAAINAAQYVLWRYSLVRSGKPKALLQQEFDQALSDKHSEASQLHAKVPEIHCETQGPHGSDALDAWEPLSFILLVIFQLGALEVNEGTQIRLMRMLFRALPAGSHLLAKHVDFIEREASRLTPAALTDLISICNAQSEATPPFRSAAGKKRLAEIVETYYLSRNCGEAIKLSTTLRFVKAHQLAPFMDEAVLMQPVLGAFNEGTQHHAWNLGENDVFLQLYMISFALRKGWRLAAGRLVDRFGVGRKTVQSLEIPNWSSQHGCFQEECEACLREAEDAEERELRAATDRKMAAAAEEDAISLQLPDSVAQQVFFVANAADLDDVEQRLSQLVTCDGGSDHIFKKLAEKGRTLGLDAEWKPFLEKRGGMQKHQRSTQSAGMEPCSTLQVAADDFVVVFDLLSLAPKKASTASRLSRLLSPLFSHSGILKIGFGLQHDLQRLAASYPHLECFRCMNATLDVQDSFMTLRREKGQSTGLSALCVEHFGLPLSKRLQTSDWGARPLSKEQLLYAALDAFCLLGLARKLPAEILQTQNLKVQSVGEKLVVSAVGTLPAADAEEVAKLDADISSKGAEIRAMKAAGQPKSAWQAEVAVLLQLKSKYRDLAGFDWVPPVNSKT